MEPTHNPNVEAFSQEITAAIHTALAEDIGTGDVTTNSIVPPEARMAGEIIAKQAGVVAGLDVARRVFFDLRSGGEF